MISKVVFNKVHSFLLAMFALLKRAMCCFRKRRRPSVDFEPLTQVGIVSSDAKPTEMQPWNDWGDFGVQKRDKRPNTIEEHIQWYRQQTIASRQEKTPQEVQKDFFEDMTPRITKQKKIVIQTHETDHQDRSELSLAVENVNVIDGELGEWDENDGWEDETMGDDIQEAVREAKRQARQKRVWEQQQKRQEKFVRPALGAKLGS